MFKATFRNLVDRIRPWVGPIFVLVMLIAALWLLQLELQKHTLQDFLDELKKIPVGYLLLAIFLTVLNYAILVCYDWLGIWYIRHPMKFGRVALASFLGYAVGNNFGLLFGGSTIRYRLYSSWGLSTSDIVRLLFILAITFWIGLFALSGIVFLINPMPIPEFKEYPWLNDWIPFETTRPLGIILTLAASSYLVVCAVRRKPLKFKEVDCSPPPIGLAIMQYIVASIDLVVMAAVMYALLKPVIDMSFAHFVTIFLMAQVAVFVTQVPGGIGVLELLILTMVGGDEAAVFGALLAYRMIFYLTPMVIGLVLLVAQEITTNRQKLRPAFEALSRWTPDIAPRLLAFTAFSSGVVLLFAAATPTTTDRIARLNGILPMWLIDTSYVLSAVCGTGLMVVARGITHRVVSTYWVTLALYVLGAIFSLAGDFGIEVSAFLMVMILVHAPCKHYFFRDDVTYPDRIAIAWVTGIFVVLGVSFWLMWFAYKGGEPLSIRWLWESGHDTHGQRSLRALFAALMAFSVFTLVRTLRITLRKPKQVSRSQLNVARSIVANSNIADAQMALLGDKRLLMNAEKTALVSYSIQGNSWVAYGDPVGPRKDALQVAWDFFELSKSGDNLPVFYNASQEWLDIYSEMGLEITKIAQEAKVDLQSFDLSTSHRREFDNILKRFDQDGYSFRVTEPPEVRDQLPVLQRISDIWLRDGNKREYRFAIPFFDGERVGDLPVGLAEKSSDAHGFATIWRAADKSELAIGLLRYLPDSPNGITEYLIVQTMIWGKQHGYKSLNLGSAPTPEDQASQESPLRSELSKLIFPHAEHVYTRHGLRNFKERFDPIWQPKYLASPGKSSTKQVLQDIAALIHET